MEGRILTFNRAAETITSLAASDVVGRGIAEIMQLPEVFQSLFVPGAIPSGTQRHEFGYRRWDGREILMGMTSAPLITPRGESGFLFTFQDVTELKKRDREARVPAPGGVARWPRHRPRSATPRPGWRDRSRSCATSCR
jgi:PAS domain S-box-containing protein